ncbi:hypothetical protein C8J57DRAFT_1239585 [Mycena rebaudengoi]|nr:hypothetical protein C8J57DRAFT_1239585 [Mycena rebaudengoi]
MGVNMRRKGKGGKVENIDVSQNSPHTPDSQPIPPQLPVSQHLMNIDATLNLWRVSQAVPRGGQGTRYQSSQPFRNPAQADHNRARSREKSEEEDVVPVRRHILPARQEKAVDDKSGVRKVRLPDKEILVSYPIQGAKCPIVGSPVNPEEVAVPEFTRVQKVS